MEDNKGAAASSSALEGISGTSCRLVLILVSDGSTCLIPAGSDV